MKFCPECGKGRVGSKCGCGFTFKNASQHAQATVKLECGEAFQMAVQKKRQKYGAIAGVILGALWGTLILMYFTGDLGLKSKDLPFAMIFPTVFSLIIVINCCYVTLSHTQYYALEGTQGPDGEHRCVLCGWKGIYRSTVYKTNTVHCKCAKCKTLLFHE